jgi:hypothetical protein
VRPLSTIGVLVLLAALTTLFLPTLPVLAGGLLAAGGALAAWAGWAAGVAKRPRLQPIPVEEPSRRRAR